MANKKTFDAMKALVSEYLSECCEEILEWQATGILCDGVVRKAGRILEMEINGLSNVEAEVARQAMRLVTGKKD